MLTDMALEDPSCGGNPIAMTRENTRALFEACL
jgi:alcohol dehydrogenase class IV